MTGNNNMWLDGIMGVVIGDALGCPVQFESRKEVAKHPVTGMRGYGTFNLPEGSWTDDSSLTLALLESIRRLGRIDLDDIMENFMKWLYDGEFTPYGYSYDVGRGTMLAIGRYKKNRKAKKCGGDEEWNNGNGSLMRILPVCIYNSGKLRGGDLTEHDAIQAVHSVGGLTHAHIRSNIACGLYFFMVGWRGAFRSTSPSLQTRTIFAAMTGCRILQSLQPSPLTGSGAPDTLWTPWRRLSGPWPRPAASRRRSLRQSTSEMIRIP